MGRYKQCLETKLESHRNYIFNENKKIEEKIANTNQSIANLESKNEKRWVNIDDSMNGLIQALNNINFNNNLLYYFCVYGYGICT